MVDPSKLKCDAEYQRSFEPARYNKILRSIKDFGFWSFRIFLINEKLTVMDGQHGLKAVKDLNIPYVLACVIKFCDKKTESDYFAQFDSFNTTLSSFDLIDAKMKGRGDILADVIYKLDSSETSLLKDKIKLKGKLSKYKYSISYVIKMINYIAFDTAQHFEFKKADPLRERLINAKYYEIEYEINNFITFLRDTWGEYESKHKVKPDHLKDWPFTAILRFYMELRRIGALQKKSYKSTINKMRKFDNFKPSNRFDHTTTLLVEFFNTKKSESNRIRMILEVGS